MKRKRSKSENIVVKEVDEGGMGIEEKEPVGNVVINFFNRWCLYGMPLNWVVAPITRVKKEGSRNVGKLVVTRSAGRYFQRIEDALVMLKERVLLDEAGVVADVGEYEKGEVMRGLEFLTERVLSVETSITNAVRGMREIEDKLRKFTFMGHLTEENYRKVVSGSFKPSVPTVNTMKEMPLKKKPALATKTAQKKRRKTISGGSGVKRVRRKAAV